MRRETQNSTPEKEKTEYYKKLSNEIWNDIPNSKKGEMFPENDNPREINEEKEFEKISRKIYKEACRDTDVQERLEFNSNQKKIIDEVKKITYPQNWSAYNAAQTREKIISEKLLLELLDSFDQKELKPRPGRPGFSLKDRIYCMFMYTYNGYSSRRCVSDFKIATERKLLETVPHFNTLLNYFSNTSATPLLKKLIYITSLPLRCIENDFAVDSSGFSAARFERWFNVRTQQFEKKRHWKKCHLIVGVKSNIITGLEITDGISADSPELIPLVQHTRKFFDMREVSADKAYLSRKNMEEISNVGAIPYIPFKSNSKRNPRGSQIWSRMFDYFLNNKEMYMKSYHKRSNVETAFHMIKRKFGNHLKTKKDESHINEILMKCICHNLAVLVQESMELGLEIDLSSCAKILLAQKEFQ